MSRLAAIVFDRDDDPDRAIGAFIADLQASGVRVGGLVQESDPASTTHEVFVRDLDTSARLPIMQDLGPHAEGCRVDPAAIAAAAALLEQARARKPDIIVVNRFGRLESEGGGMIAEIGRAVADGDALMICIPVRYHDAWNAFAGGCDLQMPPRLDALRDWWTNAALSPADA